MVRSSSAIASRLRVLLTLTMCVSGVGAGALTLALPASAAAPASLAPASGQYFSVPMREVLDTPSGLGETSAQPLGAGVTINVAVTGADGVPSSATAVVAEIHAVNPGAGGFLSDGSSNTPIDTAPAIGLRAGVDTDQAQIIEVGSNGEIYITNNSPAAVGLTVAIMGYFSGADAATAGDTYFDSGWNKIVDTRSGVGTGEAPIPAGGSITVQAAGMGGIATGAAVAVLQLSAINATAAGWLTAYAAGSADPGLRVLSYNSGSLRYQNLLYSPLSAAGQLTITNHGTTAIDVMVMARGYFMPPSTTTGGAEYTVLDPTSIYGTAGTGTPLAANASATFQASGANGIPAAAGEIVEDLVVTSPTASGTITGYRGGGTLPVNPTLSFLAGDGTDVAASDQLLSQLSPTGQEAVTNSSPGTLNVQVIARGYYLAATTPEAPASVKVTTSGQSATISWAAPASDGGSPITSFTVKSAPDAATVTTGPGTTGATLTGLSNAAGDSFTVTATNAIGTSPVATFSPVKPAVTVLNTVSAGTPIAAGATTSITVGGIGGLPAYGVGEAGLAIAIANETASGYRKIARYTFSPRIR